MFRRFFAMAMAAGFAALTVPAHAAETITIVGSEWCPYNCALKDPHQGYMIDVARKVFGDAGYQVDYVIENWARAIDETKAGKYTGLVGSSKRDGFLFSSVPLGIAQNGFAVRKGEEFVYKNPDSLKGKVLGGINDYSYTDQIDKYIAANRNDTTKVQITSGDDALTLNLKKLGAHRVDVVVDDMNVLRAAITQMGATDKFSVISAGAPDPVYIAISAALPKGAEYNRVLGDGIARLRASGELARILAPYGLKDWQ